MGYYGAADFFLIFLTNLSLKKKIFEIFNCIDCTLYIRFALVMLLFRAMGKVSVVSLKCIEKMY